MRKLVQRQTVKRTGCKLTGRQITSSEAAIDHKKNSFQTGGSLITTDLQNSARFEAQSVSMGLGTVLSVGEQSTIRAGDAGFQVNVQGQTALTGGQITSTQAAVDAGKNTYSSAGGVQTTDLQNSARFEAQSVSVGVGTGAPSPGATLSAGMSGVGIGSDKGTSQSTSTAGISGVAGNTAARTGDAETGIAQIFDKDKVKQEVAAQVEITSEFGKNATQAWGEFSNKRFEEAVVKGDEESAKCWAPDGACRAGGHAVVGGLTGDVGGALAAGGSSIAAPHVQAFFIEQGVPPTAAAALTQLSALGAGTAIGGSAGGAAAFNEASNNAVLAIPLLVEGVILGGAVAARACMNSPACLNALRLAGTATVAKVASLLSPDELTQIPGVSGGIFTLNEAVNPDASSGTDNQDKPSLLDPKGETHILEGDQTGGGHRPGTGKPGKSEFPSEWTDDRIKGEISDVATDPASSRQPGRGGREVVRGTRGGVDIEVIVDPNGRIVTGYPTNIPRNPR